MQNPNQLPSTSVKIRTTDRETQQKEIRESRRELLDLLEVALAGSPSWPIVRTKVMEIFGRNGLQGGSR